MIRFACPHCDKGLRADDAKAGNLVRCPACGHKVSIPHPEPKPAPPEDTEPQDAEPERPTPRRKRKAFRRKPTESDRGRAYVIAIICIVLGMHLLGLIRYLAAPDPFEASQRAARDVLKDLGRDLPKDFEAKLDEQLKQMAGGKELQDRLRWAKLQGLVIMVG